MTQAIEQLMRDDEGAPIPIYSRGPEVEITTL